jgi:DNA-binding MarR family transcriptional regulator
MTYFIDREVTEFLFDLNQIQGSADCANIHSGRGMLFGAGPGASSMSVPSHNQESRSPAEAGNDADVWADHGSDFVLVAEGRPPSRIALAHERMLVSRLYLGLLRTITDDYGAEFAAHSDSLTLRTIGIYLFLRTVMCSPARASQIAHALKLPRAAVLRRLQELVKGGYVERVGNAYRVTDRVNISDLQIKLQRRIEMITDTAKKLSEMTLRH